MPDQHFPSLTPQAEHLLAVLRRVETWVNRSELARLTEKSALNKWDLVLLIKLVEADLIESRQISHHGPIGYEWQYRVVRKELSEQAP